MLNTGKIYLNKILGITLCWALWEDLFTHTTGKYFMLSTMGILIYTQYWGLLYVEPCGKIYLHKILGITFMLNTSIKYFPVVCVIKSSHSAQHKVIPSILFKYIFPVFNIKYFPVFYVNKYSHSVQQEVIPSILCKEILSQCLT
jgi:hypothetical protein